MTLAEIEEVKRLKAAWAAKRGKLRVEVKRAKTRARDAHASEVDFARQLSDLRAELYDVR